MDYSNNNKEKAPMDVPLSPVDAVTKVFEFADAELQKETGSPIATMVKEAALNIMDQGSENRQAIWEFLEDKGPIATAVGAAIIPLSYVRYKLQEKGAYPGTMEMLAKRAKDVAPLTGPFLPFLELTGAFFSVEAKLAKAQKERNK